MNLMKRNLTIRKKNRSRRKFLKSTGAFFAGLTFIKPFSMSAVSSANERRSAKDDHLFMQDLPKQQDPILPDGIKAVWDISKAWRDATPTRERICINGLWQWQPVVQQSDQVPSDGWGYFKVPGNWQGVNNYMQRDSQRLYPHPDWSAKKFENLTTAWYKREITIPAAWKNRRIVLNIDYVNSSALIFINDKPAGEIMFPGGESDLTSFCSPGHNYSLAIKLTALPLQDVVAVFSDSNAPRTGKGTVARPGLCGDVYLSGLPLKTMIKDVRIYTSYRRKEVTFRIAIDNLNPDAKYSINAIITDKGMKVVEFTDRTFKNAEMTGGYVNITEKWKPDKLWDIHTPGNMYDLTVSLFASNKKLIDTSFSTRFGFREFWIEGRDFYLNGSRIYLSAVPFDNGQIGAALACYEGARESMRRLKSFGINFVYTHNYGCEPGTHISFAEILKAADDEGMLISLSQPHFGQYEWTAEDADKKNGYAHHAGFYTSVAQNHPSVVFFSMSHNATGYTDDMNPDLIDGINRTDSQWSQNNVKKALRAEALVSEMDPSRIVYHHSSGNLSPIHSSNFYPNWVPIQEMNDWFEHWATVGVKPLMLCEFGAPFTWDWAIYRGWYKGKREFGSAIVPWEFCLAEWNAQFLGDKAYMISEMEKENLRWEASRFSEGAVWSRNNYPYNFDSRVLEERNPVFAMHIRGNWRSFRTWGVSINSPWHHGPYFKMKEDLINERKEFAVDWENLQYPGLSPDFISERASRMDLDVGNNRADWIPNEAGEALIENNMALLAYIAGKPTAFTSQDHNFRPGSSFKKQLVVINNSRESVSCECKWKLNLPVPVEGSQSFILETGQQERIPLTFKLPTELEPGNYELGTSVKFNNAELRNDTFFVHIVPSISLSEFNAKVALFDPEGSTGMLLKNMGIAFQTVKSGDDLSEFDILVLGKKAFTTDSEGIKLDAVKKGLKVIIFEQTSEVLERRFGFRVQEYGLRKVYRCIPDHPVLEGLGEENLRDWEGDSTIVPSRLRFEDDKSLFNGVQTVKWCDIPVTRIWRCGNRGNVATVLIEKPTCGNFLPLIDGGYSLHYTPLMEYREGTGVVIFCQMDVTGRSETEPAAEKLVWNLLKYMSEWKPGKIKQAVYSGNNEGLEHLKKTGISCTDYVRKPDPDQVLVIGPGGGLKIASDKIIIEKWMKAGGQLLAIGCDQADTDAILTFKVIFRKEEHIAAWFEPFGNSSFFAGISPADVHFRAPKELSKVSSGAVSTGDGILAYSQDGKSVFCQIVPWQLDYSREQHNVKQTYRRTSFMLSRLMGNMGISSSVPILDHISTPVVADKNEKRWLDGLYVDVPEEWDDPYRFFRW